MLNANFANTYIVEGRVALPTHYMASQFTQIHIYFIGKEINNFASYPNVFYIDTVPRNKTYKDIVNT